MRKRIITLILAAGTGAFTLACDSKPKGPTDSSRSGDARGSVIVAVEVDPCGQSVKTVTVSAEQYDQAYTNFLVSARKFADSLKTAETRVGVVPRSAFMRLASFEPPRQPGANGAPQSGVSSLVGTAPRNVVRDTSHRLSKLMVTSLLGTAQAIIGKKVTRDDACRGAATPEVQDAQRLIEGRSFGPLAQIVTRPGVDLKEYTDYSTYRLAAFIEVTLDSGMTQAQYHALPHYAALHLEPTVNCLFLRRTSGTWEARIMPQTTAGVCDSTQAGSGTALSVVSSPPNSAAGSPPNSRFVEAADRSPLIGVRCAQERCLIGPSGLVAAEIPIHLTPVPGTGVNPLDLPHAPPHSWQSERGLWFDEQHLAVYASPGATPTPAFRASVIPDMGLRERKIDDFKKGWVIGAFVYASTDPPATYVQEFGYSKGWNRVYLHLEGTIWMSLVLDANYGVHVRPVTNYPHTFGDTPGTVRWAWVDADEWIWIPCADGCCLVENGKD